MSAIFLETASVHTSSEDTREAKSLLFTGLERSFTLYSEDWYESITTGKKYGEIQECFSLNAE